MTKFPKISVIVPCYNVEAYLIDCLNSLAAQTFTDFEVICVEDCSTDGTRNLLNAYKRPVGGGRDEGYSSPYQQRVGTFT